jgi:[NiFe] hydrogenase assembly HybE family chaperone
MVIGSASVIEDDAVQNLANTYRRAALKVKGLPIYNPTLAVEAVGFREHEGRQAGVIVAPWFMNLVVIPSEADRTTWLPAGTVRLRFPSGEYDFMVQDLHGFGLVGTCALFATMHEFTDHEAAQTAAVSIADGLFQPEQPTPAPTVSRRQLFGG